MSGARTILHVDMDAFFASAEQLDDPGLRGTPVLVGYDGPRGVVAAASYEARVYGCHSAQPMAVAKRNCPHAVIVRGRYARYRELSDHVFAILHDVTPLVQPLSIDEAFLDVTGSRALFGPPRAIAETIRARIHAETGLTASVGVAPNKFLAKLASDWDKPDGLTVITADELPDRLAPVPIGAMWGVGPALERKLARHGIHTFGDLARWPPAEAARALGTHAEHYQRLARGEDDRPVSTDRRAKSIGHEQTFVVDVAEPGHVRTVLLGQCESVGVRLRRHDLCGRTVTVKIRYGDFETITRSTTLDAPTDRTDLIWHAAAELFDCWCRAGFRSVRLIGATVSHLAPLGAGQLPLFADADEDRHRRLDAATDSIRARFGSGSIHRGLEQREKG